MCSHYSTPPLCLQPWFWVSLYSQVVDTWATTMREVRKPSGSPLRNSSPLSQPVSPPNRTSKLQSSVLGRMHLLQNEHERLDPGE